jgi:hypothetical protein
MTGVIALQGGGPFTANDDLDARLLAEVGAIGADGADGAGRRVVVLPTADAFEHPERLVTAAIGWAERSRRRGRGVDGAPARRGDGRRRGRGGARRLAPSTSSAISRCTCDRS